MIEYANESATRLLKQYEMLSKSLRFTRDYSQREEISVQMTKIIQSYFFYVHLKTLKLNLPIGYPHFVNKLWITILIFHFYW